MTDTPGEVYPKKLEELNITILKDKKIISDILKI
jgi:hypothetical protein